MNAHSWPANAESVDGKEKLWALLAKAEAEHCREGGGSLDPRIMARAIEHGLECERARCKTSNPIPQPRETAQKEVAMMPRRHPDTGCWYFVYRECGVEIEFHHDYVEGVWKYHTGAHWYLAGHSPLSPTTVPIEAPPSVPAPPLPDWALPEPQHAQTVASTASLPPPVHYTVTLTPPEPTPQPAPASTPEPTPTVEAASPPPPPPPVEPPTPYWRRWIPERPISLQNKITAGLGVAVALLLGVLFFGSGSSGLNQKNLDNAFLQFSERTDQRILKNVSAPLSERIDEFGKVANDAAAIAAKARDEVAALKAAPKLEVVSKQEVEAVVAKVHEPIKARLDSLEKGFGEVRAEAESSKKAAIAAGNRIEAKAGELAQEIAAVKAASTPAPAAKPAEVPAVVPPAPASPPASPQIAWHDLKPMGKFNRINGKCGATAVWGDVDVIVVADVLDGMTKEEIERVYQTCDVAELVKKAKEKPSASPQVAESGGGNNPQTPKPQRPCRKPGMTWDSEVNMCSTRVSTH